MGNLSTVNVDQNQQLTNLKINLDFKKPILDELKQLTNWSLEEIRQIYVPFRKRKGSPIMSRSEFLRFIGLSRITSFFIYDKMKQTAAINVFQILAVLTLTAYGHRNHKVQFLFNIFDLEANKLLQFKELVLMFTSLIRGYGIITGQPLPDHANLQKYAQTMFSRADLNNDQHLQLGEVLGWFQSYSDGTSLLNRFEPTFLGKQSYHVFNGFPSYSQTQIDIIFQRLNKVYHNEELSEEDFKILTRMRKTQKPKDFYKQNLFSDSMYFTAQENRKFLKPTISSGQSKKSRQTTYDWGTQSSEMFSKDSRYKMPKIKETSKSKSTLFKQINNLNYKLNSVSLYSEAKNSNMRSMFDSKFSKKSFNNIIIIKGKTITKKQVFDMRDYFDKISNGKKTILIEDFLQSFNQEKYNHMKSVAASLYNFLDRKQNGKVTFEELVLKLYPDLTKQHLKLIQTWSQEYSSSFNLDKKIKANRQQEQHKKRVLPKSCVPRFKQIYLLFDRDRKGYVTFDDLKRVLSDVSTDKQLIQTFQDCDLDQDGKLSFQEFSHILLPPDLQIQGLQ